LIADYVLCFNEIRRRINLNYYSFNFKGPAGRAGRAIRPETTQSGVQLGSDARGVEPPPAQTPSPPPRPQSLRRSPPKDVPPVSSEIPAVKGDEPCVEIPSSASVETYKTFDNYYFYKY